MKVYVISLANSNRREDLKERLAIGGITDYEIVDAQFPHQSNGEFIKALTGKDWSKDPRLKNETKNESRKACYISHVSQILVEANFAGEKEILVLEDDMVFKDNIFEALKTEPEDSLITFFDTTHIEQLENGIVPYWEGYHKIDNDHYRIWCAGCTKYNNVEKVVKLLFNDKPKVFDKMLINIQKKEKCFVRLPGICFQDRKTFISDIK
jgi:GR25 family glycosyltransferase involved in LPS biosynthesis